MGCFIFKTKQLHPGKTRCFQQGNEQFSAQNYMVILDSFCSRNYFRLLTKQLNKASKSGKYISVPMARYASTV